MLELTEHDGRCRLVLGSSVRGEGTTLQDAADDLVARVLSIVMSVRSSGFRISREMGPPDFRWLGFLWELGDLAAEGHDIRERIFLPQPAAVDNA
jgi:hypothetical protein